MNTMETCNRFEREGILRIERGLSLDAHFEECPACEVARQKYESLLAALPSGQPDVAPPSGWQSRVLQAAAKSNASRWSFSFEGLRRPFVWTAMAGVAAMATASLIGLSPAPPQFEVQAETHSAAPTSDLAVEEPNAAVTGEDEKNAADHVAPRQPTTPKVAPRQPALIAQQVAPKPDESWFPPPAPVKPAPPVTAPVTQSEAIVNSGPPSPATRPVRVVRPDVLYGLAIKYPPAAMKAKVQGEVSVQCTIQADGRNTNCKILKSLPYLDSAVIRAVEAARSEPIRVDGKAVDNSDHIWHITITLREIVDDRTSARNLPTLNWN